MAQDQPSNDVVSHYPEFRRRLTERREEILKRAKEARENYDEQLEAGPGDSADLSELDMSADYFLNLANNQQAELRQISSALDRIEKGTYGICESCENPIPLERLRTQPYARYDVRCQAMLEKRIA